MKINPSVIILVYLLLIAGGSWYFGGYSQKVYNQVNSYNHFKQCVAKAEEGMNKREIKTYDNLAGISGGRGSN